MYSTPKFFFWNSLLLNGLPFNKLGNASHRNLQLSGIAYFGKFWKLGEKKCLIRRKQPNFLLYVPSQPKILAN